MDKPRQIAQLLFVLEAVLGVMSIGGAALYGVAWSPNKGWMTFGEIFVPFSVLWLLFCYGAYRSVVGVNPWLRGIFWLFVLTHIFVFPVGTAIAGTCIWLRRAFEKQPPT